MLSKDNVHPLDATKQSVAIIRKVWGESFVVNMEISLIGFLSFLAYLMLGSAATLGLFTAGHALHTSGLGATVGAVTVISLFVVVLLMLILVFSALSGIAKAALYHYATTGEAPSSFDSKLLQASMTPKKARKIFG